MRHNLFFINIIKGIIENQHPEPCISTFLKFGFYATNAAQMGAINGHSREQKCL